MIRINLTLICCVCCVAILLVGCAPEGVAANPSFASPAYPAPAVTVFTLSSQVVASSFSELSHWSDVIVIGRVVSADGYINGARDVIDPNQPDPRWYSIAQAHRFEVEQTLKGNVSGEIILLQNQGFMSLTGRAPLSLDEIEAEAARNRDLYYRPFSPEKTYLMFLARVDYTYAGYEGVDIYVGAMEPWQYEVLDNGWVMRDDTNAGLGAAFPPLLLERLVEEINKPYAPVEVVPYPGPVGGEYYPATPYP